MATITNPKPLYTKIARDADDVPLLVIGLMPLTAHHTPFTSQLSVIQTAIQSGVQILQLIATQPCHYLLGNGSFTVTTDAFFLPANVPETINRRDFANVGVIGIVGGTAGTLHTTEKT